MGTKIIIKYILIIIIFLSISILSCHAIIMNVSNIWYQIGWCGAIIGFLLFLFYLIAEDDDELFTNRKGGNRW